MCSVIYSVVKSIVYSIGYNVVYSVVQSLNVLLLTLPNIIAMRFYILVGISHEKFFIFSFRASYKAQTGRMSNVMYQIVSRTANCRVRRFSWKPSYITSSRRKNVEETKGKNETAAEREKGNVLLPFPRNANCACVWRVVRREALQKRLAVFCRFFLLITVIIMRLCIVIVSKP